MFENYYVLDNFTPFLCFSSKWGWARDMPRGRISILNKCS